MIFESLFIVEQSNQGWIIERLMRDIAQEMNSRNIKVTIGGIEQYNGEQVLFNSRYDHVFYKSNAKINSVFVTHIDDKLKELDIRVRLKKYNSLVCMSKNDEDYLCALDIDPAKIIGIDLPMREAVLEPLKLSLFTACYPDGRKNEKWLHEYFVNNPAYINSCVLQFMGQDWEYFLLDLKKLNCNYEYYRYRRDLPNEYERYKNILKDSSYLLYMGFDGGAMCAYDALSTGVPSILPNMSYHRGLEINSTQFNDKNSFFMCLDKVFEKHISIQEVIDSRKISVYVDELIGHWSDILNNNMNNKLANSSEVKSKILESHRNHYHKIDVIRIRIAISKFIKFCKAYFND
jgi:hypothetical protein